MAGCMVGQLSSCISVVYMSGYLATPEFHVFQPPGGIKVNWSPPGVAWQAPFHVHTQGKSRKGRKGEKYRH